MSSQTEILIEKLEEYVDHCKWFPLSTVKIVVNKDEIEAMLRELRTVSMTERRGSVETEILLEKLEKYIGQCKFYPLSTVKIVVNKDEIDAMLRELRTVPMVERRGSRKKVMESYDQNKNCKSCNDLRWHPNKGFYCLVSDCNPCTTLEDVKAIYKRAGVAQDNQGEVLS